ncbi:EamA family transporter RarD [Kutzneria viridogrisea]|uniref:Chloramphenicol-sensitive protein RarD n=1 Tax=Kutzneria viridogrisea TaxID=47990 RepID=A0ABR6BHJ7_9PSEU|nr:chloramphenicol-sensitive protein RarD [Kutzneria viridogrisea]
MVASLSASDVRAEQSRRGSQGLWLAVAAYGVWGLFPLYWPLLSPAGAVEILANRMVWSLAVILVLLLVRNRWGWVRELLRQPVRLVMLVLASAAISVNWGVYIWGVNNGHVVETSLGYFINPLVTIAFGVVLLRERLRTVQWVAVGIGLAAVLVLSFAYGRPPWISLVLAFSFGTYGLLKKRVNLPAIEGLAAETVVQFVPAAGYLVWLQASGAGSLGQGWSHTALLVGTGVITVIPLLCFGAAAIRLPLSTIGLVQYLAPVFQFLVGVLVVHEQMSTASWVGFGMVWLALLVLVSDALRPMLRFVRR